jgi:nitrous oxidase accessory protein NosD
MKLRVLIVSITGIGLSLATAAPAIAAPTDPTPAPACGAVLTADTTLHSDLTCAGTALSIGAAGITVNLAGHTITGDGTGAGISNPFPGYPNVTIHHGTIANFAADVSLDTADDETLHHLRLGGGGTAPRGGNGVSALFSDNLRLTDVSLVDAGIRLDSSKNTTVSRSVLQRSRLTTNWSGAGLALSGNTVTDSSLDLRQADNTVIAGNCFTRSSLYVSEIRNLTVRDNRIADADIGLDAELITNGFQVTGNTFAHNRVGLRTGPVITDATIAGNAFLANTATGLAMTQGPATGTVRANAFIGNGDGLSIAVVSGSDILVADNHSRANAGYGIVVADPGTVRDGGGNTSVRDPSGCVGVVCT